MDSILGSLNATSLAHYQHLLPPGFEREALLRAVGKLGRARGSQSRRSRMLVFIIAMSQASRSVPERSTTARHDLKSFVLAMVAGKA